MWHLGTVTGKRINIMSTLVGVGKDLNHVLGRSDFSFSLTFSYILALCFLSDAGYSSCA